MTPLDKSFKRALQINARDYVITLTPEALKITEKGHRLGIELKWEALISGEAALATALQASVGKFPMVTPSPADGTKNAKRR